MGIMTIKNCLTYFISCFLKEYMLYLPYLNNLWWQKKIIEKKTFFVFFQKDMKKNHFFVFLMVHGKSFSLFCVGNIGRMTSLEVSKLFSWTWRTFWEILFWPIAFHANLWKFEFWSFFFIFFNKIGNFFLSPTQTEKKSKKWANFLVSF